MEFPMESIEKSATFGKAVQLLEENPIPLKSDVILAQEKDERPFHVRAWELKVQTTKKAKHIAADCGLAESTVSRYLSGTSVPSEEVARKILQYLRENLVQDGISAPGKIPQPPKMQEESAEDMKLALDTLKTVYEARVADLKESLKERIATTRREKSILFCAFCVAVAVLVYVLLDASNPGWGSFMPRG